MQDARLHTEYERKPVPLFVKVLGLCVREQAGK